MAWESPMRGNSVNSNALAIPLPLAVSPGRVFWRKNMKRCHHIPAVFTRTIIAVFALAVVPSLRADLNGLGAGSTNAVDGGSGTATVSSVGPNSRTWSLPPDANLLAAIATNATLSGLTNSHQVVEVATGLNYFDGQQWQSSVAAFQISSN